MEEAHEHNAATAKNLFDRVCKISCIVLVAHDSTTTEAIDRAATLAMTTLIVATGERAFTAVGPPLLDRPV